MTRTRTPRRIVCTNPNLQSHGLFGTIVGSELTQGALRVPAVKPGTLLDVVWLDYPDEGSDEIDGSNVKIVTETTYQIEVLERRIDDPRSLVAARNWASALLALLFTVSLLATVA